MRNRPSRAEVKSILHKELLKYESKGFEALSHLAQKNEVVVYELSNDWGKYQVKIEFDKEPNEDLVNIIGAIDGPGVRHFLGIVFSVTDIISLNSNEDGSS